MVYIIVINSIKNTTKINLISNDHCLLIKQVTEFFVFLCFLWKDSTNGLNQLKNQITNAGMSNLKFIKIFIRYSRF